MHKEIDATLVPQLLETLKEHGKPVKLRFPGGQESNDVYHYDGKFFMHVLIKEDLKILPRYRLDPGEWIYEFSANVKEILGYINKTNCYSGAHFPRVIAEFFEAGFFPIKPSEFELVRNDKLNSEVFGGTWFEYEGVQLQDWTSLVFSFSSREDGCVGAEEPGQSDMIEAERLVKVAESLGYKSNWYTIDEWVHVDVILTPEGWGEA